MSMAAKIALMLIAMTNDDVEMMQPEERRRFAKLCRHWADKAEPEPRVKAPRSGVLARLSDGERAL